MIVYLLTNVSFGSNVLFTHKPYNLIEDEPSGLQTPPEFHFIQSPDSMNIYTAHTDEILSPLLYEAIKHKIE